MEIRIRPLLPHLISPEQKAFQQDKNIVENTQLVQDVIAYCNENKISGMILFCDQDNAYPRIEWDFMSMVMSKMRVHVDFTKMVKIMYKDATLQIKISFHVEEGFHPKKALPKVAPSRLSFTSS
jgi:hypothetical protein